MAPLVSAPPPRSVSAEDRNRAADELRLAKQWDPDNKDRASFLAHLDHAEAAIQLDPNLEAAYAWRVWALSKRETEFADAERVLAAAAAYFDRFDDRAGSYGEVCGHAQNAVKWCADELTDPSPAGRLLLAAARKVVEGMAEHGTPGGLDADVLLSVHDVMEAQGIPLRQRTRWLDRILEACDRRAVEPQAGDPGDKQILSCVMLRGWVASQALCDHQPERAERLLARAEALVASHPEVFRVYGECGPLWGVVVQFDDPTVLRAMIKWWRGVLDHAQTKE
jgi:hypothetical protein